MLSPFKTLGAVVCLVFALCFAAPSAHADTFTYSYTSTQFGFPCSVDPSLCFNYSWTTVAIAAVTAETVLLTADLTPSSIINGCLYASVVLDVGGVGGQGFNSTCGGGGVNPDGFSLADYSTPGTYTATAFQQFDTLVVTAVATPEPSSLALMLSGVGLVFAMRKRWASGLQQAS